ncbi:predicted protein [Methanosarcina acetivorans C2A]|uniref:Uncharacterized protein n=1 Tax=Methanosarcina acetivorans (strain ATCC 35395 / DSM 2834 / JCM 12185 / C2A) TaxID=188937 RepID=Q8TKS7_METAC|nr:predicted protein [Methanosarcina acetivorans C2A]
MGLKFFTSNYFLFENNFSYNLFNITYVITIYWSWGTDKEETENFKEFQIRAVKESPEVADPFFESICLGEHNIRRNCLGNAADTAPLGFFLHCLRIIYSVEK